MSRKHKGPFRGDQMLLDYSLNTRCAKVMFPQCIKNQIQSFLCCIFFSILQHNIFCCKCKCHLQQLPQKYMFPVDNCAALRKFTMEPQMPSLILCCINTLQCPQQQQKINVIDIYYFLYSYHRIRSYMGVEWWHLSTEVEL